MNLLRCAVLDDYQGAALDPALADWYPLAAQVAVRAIDHHLRDPAQLVAEIEDCEIIVLMRERTPFPAALLAQLPRLRLLVTTGMRNAAIDLAAARARGVVVCGTASRSEPPVELTWALLLALARNLVGESQALRAGEGWQRSVGVDLYGKTLGLLGLGKIGGRVARVGAAFGMTVLAYSPHLTDERALAAGARRCVTKEELLAQSDFVSLHLVLGEGTRGILDTAALRCMKPTAYLINTARAQLVDAAALVQALREGWIAGAGLDVFVEEPLPLDDVLRRLPNVLATPHLGYVTRDNYRLYYREVVEDIRAFLAGAPLRRLD